MRPPSDGRAMWAGLIMAQARLRDLQCPLVWTTAASYDTVIEEKLRDLVTLAPSTWDTVVRDIVRVSRMVHMVAGSLTDIKATLARCYALVRADHCPILAAYRPALMHVLDATFVTTVCVFERKNLEELAATEHIVKFEDMEPANSAAVWAIRAQVKLTIYLSMPVSPDTCATPLMDARLAANRAKVTNPQEGQWKALYGDLMPDDNPRKLTLLTNAVRARRTPYTLTCLSRYLYKLGDMAAFDLCAEVLVEWPRSVHANVSYVMMFLSSTQPGKLSRCIAEQALLRLQRLTPSCVYVAGLALELRLRSAELRGPCELRGAGDCACPEEQQERRRPVRRRPFEPVDHGVISKALRLYCQPDGPLTIVRREDAGSLQLDRCNCVCSGYCAYLTYKAHGSLRPEASKPAACYSE